MRTPSPRCCVPAAQAVSGFDDAQRAALLRFVTSVPRPPLLGFKYLEPQLCIQAGIYPASRCTLHATFWSWQMTCGNGEHSSGTVAGRLTRQSHCCIDPTTAAEGNMH